MSILDFRFWILDWLKPLEQHIFSQMFLITDGFNMEQINFQIRLIQKPKSKIQNWDGDKVLSKLIYCSAIWATFRTMAETTGLEPASCKLM